MSLIGTGLQITSWIYWGVDWLLDLVARYLFGPWCLVCAYIWIFSKAKVVSFSGEETAGLLNHSGTNHTGK